ncbi:hypothetical protein [Streptomyces sp. Amel2xE9]|uniref:hypothetical protein n=1 Tax=Streptomyces sp. Amel2xE9 TaxID=1157634 RepID=UPI003B6355B4
MREPFIAGPPRGRGLRDLSLFSDSRVRRQVKAQETCAPVVGFRQRRSTSAGGLDVRSNARSRGVRAGTWSAAPAVGTWSAVPAGTSAGTRSAASVRPPRRGRRTNDGFPEVTSPHTGPVTRGTLCGKGRFGRQRVQNRG